MIECIYKLKEEYRKKRVCVWDITRDSIVVFGLLSFQQINIEAFVSSEQSYHNEQYMKRPIWHYKNIDNKNDILVVASDLSYKDIDDDVQEEIEVVRYSDVIGFNRDLCNKEICIYGIGKGADDIENLLYNEGIEADCYVVTEKREELNYYKKKPVYNVYDKDSLSEKTIIVSVFREDYKEEILSRLFAEGYRNVYVRELINKDVLLYINFIQLINEAINRNMNIYILVNEMSYFVELLKKVIQTYGASFKGFVRNTFLDSDCYISINSLVKEGIDDKFIIIHEPKDANRAELIQLVEDYGFSISSKNFVATDNYTATNDFLCGKTIRVLDPLTGFSTRNKEFRFDGWAEYGIRKPNSVIITVLGGSTSTEVVFRVESWVRKLYKKLIKAKIDAVIYNGSHSDADITVEILRFMRDAQYLKPDIVISMSGVNNLAKKNAANEFNGKALITLCGGDNNQNDICTGIKSDESNYDFWKRNESLLAEISKFYGAHFYSFLQPMNVTMSEMSPIERSCFIHEKSKVGRAAFSQQSCSTDGYFNMLKIFEHDSDMYFDVCHYTDRANEIIAEYVFCILQEKEFQERNENRQ